MTAPAATPSPSDLIAAKKRRTATFVLVLDEETGATAEFTFEALGRDEFRDLRLAPECRPTSEQKKQHVAAQKDAGVPGHRIVPLDNNPDVFPPKYLAAACTSPRWDEAGWAEFLGSDALNDAEYQALLGAALSTQATRAAVPDPEA